MKTPLKLITTALAAVIVGAAVSNSTLVKAQQPEPLQSPLAVVVNPTPKQYRVFDISRIPVGNGQTPAGTLEAVLNDLGTQGWSVVATSGSFVILMR